MPLPSQSSHAPKREHHSALIEVVVLFAEAVNGFGRGEAIFEIGRDYLAIRIKAEGQISGCTNFSDYRCSEQRFHRMKPKTASSGSLSPGRRESGCARVRRLSDFNGDKPSGL